MSRELKDLEVQFISLVKKGANGIPIQIYKSADYTPVEPIVPVSKEEDQIKGFFQVMKEFFIGKPIDIGKSVDLNYPVDWSSFNSRINNPKWKIWDAVDNLDGAISEVFWDSSMVDGKTKILQNIDEFKAHIEGILNQPVEVQKAFFAKKDQNNTEKEDDGEMNKEEMMEILAPISKSISDLAIKIEGLEKADAEVAEKTEEVKAEVEEVAKSAAEGVKVETNELKEVLVKSMETIQKSIEGLTLRIVQVEEARGISRQQESTEVAKSEDPWTGILNF